MARNLNGQITFAVNKCFQEGVNKHDYKAENGREMGEKIFSYSEKFRLKDMGKSLQNYIKENFPTVKRVDQIDSKVIQSFLNSKTECTQNTVNSYANTIFKLQNVLESTYKSFNSDWRNEVAIPSVERQSAIDRGADSVMNREDYNTILNYTIENPSQSGYALQIQNFMGIRVEEVARIKLENIDLDKQIITIKGKGGRTIDKPIPTDKIDLIKEIINKNFDVKNDRLLSIEGSSINKYLNRLEKKLGLKEHSNHDIRRLIAQERFDSLRKEGYSQKEAVNLTSQWLSHGNNRGDMLEKSYIKIH